MQGILKTPPASGSYARVLMCLDRPKMFAYTLSNVEHSIDTRTVPWPDGIGWYPTGNACRPGCVPTPSDPDAVLAFCPDDLLARRILNFEGFWLDVTDKWMAHVRSLEIGDMGDLGEQVGATV